jgi:ureidoacrylate peracid hydrolase
VTDTLADWIAPSRTALVIVDMQVDFASPDGVLGKAGVRLEGGGAALAAAERLVEAARAADVTIVFVGTRTSPEMDSPAWAEWIRRRGGDAALEMSVCREGTVGADFVGPKPEPGELVISKQRYSGFFRTDLDDLLRAKRRDTVIVCGVTTDCCVDATARDAFNLDYQVIVPRDACAAYEADLHANALRSLELNCAVLADTSDVLAAWGAAAL